MNRITKIQVRYTKHIPEELENGIIYISKHFNVAVHLCACGCRGEAVTPLNRWDLTENEGKVTLSPSIGNWKGERSYHAHYHIINSEIKWC